MVLLVQAWPNHLFLTGKAIFAIVRAYRSVAGLSRFGSNILIKIADAEDSAQLIPAIQGCFIVINLTTGPPAGITHSTQSIYRACLAAKVKRLIHLSSAVVYGDVESPSIHDDSPLLAEHWMPYARAKAASEIWLRNQERTPDLQTAVLRPGIVWGVRSPHTVQIARTMLQKNAYLVDNGKGIFNSIYIDNLLACIRVCCSHPDDITGYFNVGDGEVLTWHDFYSALADELDYDMMEIANVSGDHFPLSIHAVFDYIQSLPFVNNFYHNMKTRLPDTLKSAIKSRLAGKYSYERVASKYNTRPTVDREMWHLQKTGHKLQSAKFARHFAFEQPVSFQSGLRRTVNWLKFIGCTPYR